MDVPLFGSVPADINDRNAQDAPATRSRRNKRSQKKLVHIHSVKPNPYSRQTNDTVRGSTFKPKYSGDDRRLLECRIEVMELSREIMQLKKELKSFYPDEGSTAISSTAVSRQDITSSDPMAKSTSVRLGSSAMPAGLSSSQDGLATSARVASSPATSSEQQATSIMDQPASAAASPSSVLPTSGSSTEAASVSSSAPLVTPSTDNSRLTSYEATSSIPTEASVHTSSSQSSTVLASTISSNSPAHSTRASSSGLAAKKQTNVPTPAIQSEVTSSSSTAKSTATVLTPAASSSSAEIVASPKMPSAKVSTASPSASVGLTDISTTLIVQKVTTSSADKTTSTAASSTVLAPATFSSLSELSETVAGSRPLSATTLPSASADLTNTSLTTSVVQQKATASADKITSTAAFPTTAMSPSFSHAPESSSSETSISSGAVSTVSSSGSAKADSVATLPTSSTHQQQVTSSSLTDQSAPTKASLASLMPTPSSISALVMDSAKIPSPTVSNDASTTSGQSDVSPTVSSHQQEVSSSADKSRSTAASEALSTPAGLSSLRATPTVTRLTSIPLISPSVTDSSRLAFSNNQSVTPSDRAEKSTLATVSQAVVRSTVTLQPLSGSAGSATPSAFSSAQLLHSSPSATKMPHGTASSTLLVASETSIGSNSSLPAVSLYTTADQSAPTKASLASLMPTPSSISAVAMDSAKIPSPTVSNDTSATTGLSDPSPTVTSQRQGGSSSADKNRTTSASEALSTPTGLSSFRATPVVTSLTSIPLIAPLTSVMANVTDSSRQTVSNSHSATPSDMAEKSTLAGVSQAVVNSTVTLQPLSSSATGSTSSAALPTLSSAQLLSSSHLATRVPNGTASSTLLVAAESAIDSSLPAVSSYTTTDVTPTLSVPPGFSNQTGSIMATSSGTQNMTVSSTITAQGSASISPEMPTNATANITEAATTTQAPLTLTTPLPSLKTLLVDTASSTLISGLKRTLIEYKQQNESADVSDMVSRLDELIAYYEAVSLVMGIGAFIRSIKDSFPDVAQIYDEKLKKFTDDIKETIGHGKKQDRSRRTPIADMVKLLLTDLYQFENAPMNLQMREFFKGFEADRDLFAQLMSKQTTDVPADFQELFQNMNSGANIISAMDAYNTQIADLVANGDFAEVGKIALKVNVLFRAADLLIENGELDPDKVLEDPYKDLLNKFQQFELTNEALSHITESAPASLPLNEIIAYSYVYDSLRVARLGAAMDEGFCYADGLMLGVAAEYMTIAESLKIMVESILRGSEYGKFGVLLRRIIQELSWLDDSHSTVNEAKSFGVKVNSLYYKEVLKALQSTGITLTDSLASNPVESIEKLLDTFLQQLNPTTDTIQLMFQPMQKHVVYMEMKKLQDLYKLTIHDIITGLHIATGATLADLKADVLERLKEFKEYYNLPPDGQGVMLPNVGYTQLTSDLLSPLEGLQLFPDSTLTVKDILTNPPEQLRVIDIANTKKLIHKYLDEVKKKENQKLLDNDKQGQAQKPSVSDDSIDTSDPLIAQMREVLAALEQAHNTVGQKEAVSQSIKNLNTHILGTMDTFLKMTAKLNLPTDAENQPALTSLSADELIKLGMEQDFLKLVNPVAFGLKESGVSSGAHADAEHNSADSASQSANTGGKVAGSFASVAVALGGTLKAFQSACPGCLAQMFANLGQRSAEEIQLEMRATLNVLTKRAGTSLVSRGGRAGAQKVSQKVLEDGAEDVIEQGLKRGGEEGAKELVKGGSKVLTLCRRAGLCDLSKASQTVQDIANSGADIAEGGALVTLMDAAEALGDLAAVVTFGAKLFGWLGSIFGSHHTNKKDLSVANFVKSIHAMRVTQPPPTAGNAGAASDKVTAAGTQSDHHSAEPTSPADTTATSTTTAATTHGTSTTEATTTAATTETTATANTTMAGTTTPEDTQLPVTEAVMDNSTAYPLTFTPAPGTNATSPVTLIPVPGNNATTPVAPTTESGNGTSITDTTKLAIRTEPPVITTPADQTRQSSSEAHRQESTAASTEEMFPGITSLAQQLITGANYFRGSLNQTLTEVTQRSLAELRQLPSGDPKLRSTLQRLSLGQTLEGFNSAMSRTFSLTWRYALTQMNSHLLTQIAPDLVHYNDAIKATRALVYDALGLAFQAMYQSVTDQRLKLLLGAGFMDESKLTRDELLRLKACIDNDGQESFYPANLLGLLGRITSGKNLSLFEDFLIDLIQFLKGRRNGQQTLLPPSSAPGSAQEQQFVQTIPEDTEEGLAGAVTDGFLTFKDRQLFQKILNEDKDLFIDSVQQLHLRTVGNVVGGVPLDDSSPNPLFKPSTFLNIVKNPGKYRNIYATADRSLTRADTTLQSSAPLPLVVVPLNLQSKRITSQFDVKVKNITSHALNIIQRLNSDHSQRADLEQRVLIGDTLNKLNRQLGRRLIDSFEKILQPTTAGSAELSTQERSTGDDQLIAIFQTMFATVVSERLRLFLAAGYLGEGKFSRDEVLQLKSGAYDKEGKPVFIPVQLIKAVNDNLITRQEYDRFDQLLLKLSHQSSNSIKLKILSEGNRKVKDNSKLLVPRYDSSESRQRLNTILNSEKGLFIDQVKGLHLRDNQHFNADIPLDEERKRLLFLGSDLLDAIRYPDAYRLQLNRKKDPDAEPTQETEPRRMRREAGLPSATSSAARPGGILDSVVFGVLGGLFASARGQTTMPPALSSPADEHQDGGSVCPLNRSAHLDSTGNLALATLLAAKFNDRQVTFSPVEVPNFSEQELLATSPGMRLLSVSSRIAILLQLEVADFVNHLDDGKPIVSSWEMDDLVNMAILQVIPDTAAKVSETFLYEVLKSPHIGVAHERPENIFAADGSVRGKPDGDPVIFHNEVTGQTSTGGPGMSLAKAMLHAMARVRLASYQDDGLPETLHRRIVRQADHLGQQQFSGSWQASIAGTLSAPGIVDTLDARIAARNSIVPEAQSLDPVITFLSRGRYDQGKKLFMQLSALQQFNRVEALANEPDYLGLDYSAAPLEQLRADMLASTKHGRKIPRWQLLQFSQQAWQLFSHLYDSKFAAPTEAINRIKMTSTLSRGLIGGEEAQQLSKLFVSLLPRRTSASDYVSVSLAHPAQQAHSQTLVQLHRFDPVQIGEMISSYEALKSYAEEHFAEVFGDAISEPELRWELIILVAQISLERLQGALLGSWKNVVEQTLKEEYAEMFQEHNDNNDLEVELDV